MKPRPSSDHKRELAPLEALPRRALLHLVRRSGDRQFTSAVGGDASRVDGGNWHPGGGKLRRQALVLAKACRLPKTRQRVTGGAISWRALRTTSKRLRRSPGRKRGT